MPALTCVGVKKDGHCCNTIVFVENGRCGVHLNTMNKVGPNTVRRQELKYRHNKLVTDINHDEANDVVQRRLQTQENLRYERELLELNTIIAQETEANGDIDADIAVRERRIRLRERIENINRVAMAERLRRVRAEVGIQRAAIILQNNAINNQFVAINLQNNQIVLPAGLALIANDRQNVHTELVVNKVKETINTVLQIAVPPEYQTETLKTSGEIILECKLSKKAAWQMMAKYCGDEDIYEMGEGIYARVLNSVWQYIKASPDAEDLKKILAAEMEDNIGMCAQGNLSRLCNILSGYVEGMDMKSKNEILGERIAALMGIDISERATQAQAILRELMVPHEEWHVWMEPLFD